MVFDFIGIVRKIKSRFMAVVKHVRYKRLAVASYLIPATKECSTSSFFVWRVGAWHLIKQKRFSIYKIIKTFINVNNNNVLYIEKDQTDSYTKIKMSTLISFFHSKFKKKSQVNSKFFFVGLFCNFYEFKYLIMKDKFSTSRVKFK